VRDVVEEILALMSEYHNKAKEPMTIIFNPTAVLLSDEEAMEYGTLGSCISSLRQSSHNSYSLSFEINPI
jgi:hypothetical protein